jgi:hypothetical protein
MLDEKSKGKEIAIPAPAPQRGGKLVIMEALKRSMERIPAKRKPTPTLGAKKKGIPEERLCQHPLLLCFRLFLDTPRGIVAVTGQLTNLDASLDQL